MNTWRELDPSIRKALLRGEPATDPEIDRVARAYAEKELKRFQVRMFLTWFPIGLVVGALVGIFLAVADLPLVGLAPVCIVSWVGLTVITGRRKLALIRLLNVSYGTPRVRVVPGSSERLEVRVPTGGVLRMMGPVLSLVAVLFGFGVVIANSWVIGTALVLSVPSFAYTGYLLLVWALPGHPQIFDADGVHTPRYGLRIGWESIREIRVVPLRATGRDTRQVMAFVLHDDQVYLRQLPSWQAFLAKMNKKTYLSPMVMMDGLVDRPIGEIAASVAALSGLPVSTAPQK